MYYATLTSTNGASETRPRWPYHHVSPPRGGPIIQIIPIPGFVYCVLIRIVFIALYCCIMYCATLLLIWGYMLSSRRAARPRARTQIPMIRWTITLGT